MTRAEGRIRPRTSKKQKQSRPAVAPRRLSKPDAIQLDMAVNSSKRCRELANAGLFSPGIPAIVYRALCRDLLIEVEHIHGYLENLQNGNVRA